MSNHIPITIDNSSKGPRSSHMTVFSILVSSSPLRVCTNAKIPNHPIYFQGRGAKSGNHYTITLYELSLVLTKNIRPQDMKNRASCPLSRTQQHAGQPIVGWPESRANLHPLAIKDWAFIGANDQFQL